MSLRFVLLLNLSVLACHAAAAEPTWLEIDGAVYGARPDKRGPIGGGEGYTQIVTGGDHVAKDLEALLKALSEAAKGQVVFIPGNVEIDLTARIYIEKLVLEVPEGVTLAGDRGHQGSPGALLASDALRTRLVILRPGAASADHGPADPGAEPQAVPGPSPAGIRARRRGQQLLLQVSDAGRDFDGP